MSYPSSNGLLKLPGPRPCWRIARLNFTATCRACGHPFHRGWEARNCRLAEPFLCRACWHDGTGIALHD